MKLNKEMLLLYAVTDNTQSDIKILSEQVEEAILGGVTMIQLREKDVSETDYIRKAVQIKNICAKYGVPLIINDSVEVAVKSGADGVHVGAEDMSVSEIRKIVPRDFIIGATAKTVGQAKSAESSGADYLGIGAVFPSPTKKNALRITTDKLKEIVSSVSIPTVAIGGINIMNITSLTGGGMCGFAVVSAIFASDNIRNAAHELKKAALKVTESKVILSTSKKANYNNCI